jgi:thiosulfate dehydrogenase (quinone) large subunit
MTAVRAMPRTPADFGEPRWVWFLFHDSRAAWLWLIVRLYLGYQWLDAGLGKLGSPAWTGGGAGSALTGFINGALQETGGAHPQVQDWYGWFLQHAVLPNAAGFSYLVAIGETAVGVALVLGAFTGIAAFLGIFMNANYLLAGAVSTNPIMILLGVLLLLAWRNAGWIGLDRWLLPAIGTPWDPGRAFTKGDQPAPTVAGPGPGLQEG